MTPAALCSVLQAQVWQKAHYGHFMVTLGILAEKMSITNDSSLPLTLAKDLFKSHQDIETTWQQQKSCRPWPPGSNKLWLSDTRGVILVPRPLVACSGHNFYWSWQPEPVSHPRSFPVYRCTPGVYKWYLLAPGTNIAHHLASLETITCFEMCSCLKTVFMTVMTVMMQFVKFSVLQFIFYNHCDVIKVVSLSQGSYPQYQAPGAHRSRLH